MKTMLFLVALTSFAHADEKFPPRPDLATVEQFSGIDIVESRNEYDHEKGDSGAKMTEANIYVSNHDGKAHTLRIKKLELLHAHCNAQKWADRKTLSVSNYEVYGWVGLEPKMTDKAKAVVPADQDLFHVIAKIGSVQVYNECDKFAFGVSVDIDGTTKQVELPIKVTRNERK